MQPTNRLRFVERDCYVKNGEPFTHPFKKTILQQWWENFDMNKQEFIGKWRDVPLEGDNNANG